MRTDSASRHAQQQAVTCVLVGQSQVLAYVISSLEVGLRHTPNPDCGGLSDYETQVLSSLASALVAKQLSPPPLPQP